MRKHSWFLMGTAAAALCVAAAATAREPMTLAQSATTQGVLPERAPGVPMAPSPTIVQRREGAANGAARPQRNGRREVNGVGPDSDLPMPRAVPSIIAP